MPKITVITPCYFNVLNIPDYAVRMIENEKIFPADVLFEYLLIDDGSKDNTWNEMVKFQKQYPGKVKIIKLVRNFGSTNAVFSSLPHSTGDCNVVISADLQDPPELILKMYENWQRGFKLVLANRTNREEPFLQKLVSNTTHKLVQKFGLKNLPNGGFDMNLFDKEIKDILIKMDEKNTFFPFLLMWLGYEFVSIPYVRRKTRIRYFYLHIIKKNKSVCGFICRFFFPIRLISVSGLILGLLAFIYGLFVIAGKVFGFVGSSGWSSLMVVILFVSAFQMIALGIIGEYVWRGLEASRNRPNFLIEQKIGEFNNL